MSDKIRAGKEPAEKAADFIALVLEINEQKKAQVGVSPKIFIQTFGCQQNEADSETLAGLAAAMGYEITDNPAEAALITVNTCAIREHAEQKALSTIGQYKHIKNRDPSVIIAVCGCMTAQEHRQHDLKHSYPYVDIVFGTSSQQVLPRLIYEKLTRGGRIFRPDETTHDIAENMPVLRESSYRAWVSVMYGCNNFCSYCIVPYVRGRERSRDPEDIMCEVRQLAAEGYRDITLLGQNVNSYGKDLPCDYDFADLISDISEIPGDFRLRFMTSHPKDATEKLIDAMAASSKAARHFHLPIQSGSDRILSEMNRHYDREKYLRIVRYMRENIPGITLSTDIIVGFPGESEEDFKQTLDILREVRYDMIFSFIFSPRKGTPAAEMGNQVPPEVKSRRFAELLELQNEISAEINRAFVDTTLCVLCDGVSKSNENLYSGRTDGNKIVFFEGAQGDTGQFVNVKIDRAEAFALYGHKI